MLRNSELAQIVKHSVHFVKWRPLPPMRICASEHIVNAMTATGL